MYLYQSVYGQNLHASVMSACCSSGSGSPLGDVTSSPPCDVIAVTSSESRERAMMQGYHHQSLGGGVCSVGVASSSCVDMLLSAPRGASYDFPTTLAPVADGNLMFTGVAADTLVGSPSSLFLTLVTKWPFCTKQIHWPVYISQLDCRGIVFFPIFRNLVT